MSKGSSTYSNPHHSGHHHQLEVSNMSILYYPITSIVRKKEQQRSSRGLITEVLKAFCRNPFAQCNREERAKFRKELDLIKQKYEKDDIYLDVEKFFSEEDEENSPGPVDATINNNNSNNNKQNESVKDNQ